MTPGDSVATNAADPIYFALAIVLRASIENRTRIRSPKSSKVETGWFEAAVRSLVRRSVGPYDQTAAIEQIVHDLHCGLEGPLPAALCLTNVAVPALKWPRNFPS